MSFSQGEDAGPQATRNSCAMKLNNLTDNIIKKIGSGATEKLVIIGPPQSGKKTFLLLLKDLLRERLKKDEKNLLEADKVLDRCEVKLIIPGLKDEEFMPLSKFGVTNVRPIGGKGSEDIQEKGISKNRLKVALEKFSGRAKSALEYELGGGTKQYVYIGCDNNGCVPSEFNNVIACDPKDDSVSEKIRPLVWKPGRTNILDDLEERRFRYFIPGHLERFKEVTDGTKEVDERKKTLKILKEQEETFEEMIREFGLGEFLAFDIIASTSFFDLINSNFDEFFKSVKLFGSTLLSIVLTQTMAIVLLLAIGMIIEKKKKGKEKLELVRLGSKWNKLSEETKYVIATALAAKMGGDKATREDLKEAFDGLFGSSHIKELKEINEKLSDIENVIEELWKKHIELECESHLENYFIVMNSKDINIDSDKKVIIDDGRERSLITEGIEDRKNEIIEALEEGKKVLITGTKGSGKSTLAEWVIANFMNNMKKEGGNAYFVTPRSDLDDSEISKLLNYECNMVLYYDPSVSQTYKNPTTVERLNINLNKIPSIVDKIERIEYSARGKPLPTLLVLSEPDQIQINEESVQVVGGRKIKDYTIFRLDKINEDFNRRLYVSITGDDTCWEEIKDNVELPIQAKLLGNVFESLKSRPGTCEKLIDISKSIYSGYVIYSLLRLADDKETPSEYSIEKWFLPAFIHSRLIETELLSADLVEYVNEKFFPINGQGVKRQYYSIMSVPQHDLIENAISDVVDAIIESARMGEVDDTEIKKLIGSNEDSMNGNEVIDFINKMGKDLRYIKISSKFEGSKETIDLSDIIRYITDGSFSKLCGISLESVAIMMMAVIEKPVDFPFFESFPDNPCNFLNSNHMGIRKETWDWCGDTIVLKRQKSKFLELLKSKDFDIKNSAWIMVYGLIDKGIVTAEDMIDYKDPFLEMLKNRDFATRSSVWSNVYWLIDIGIITRDDQAYFLELLKNENLYIRYPAWYNVDKLIDKGIITKDDQAYFLELLKNEDSYISYWAWHNVDKLIDKSIVTAEEIKYYKGLFLEMLKNEDLDIRSLAWSNVYVLIDKSIVTAEEIKYYKGLFLEMLKNKNLSIRNSAWINVYSLIDRGIITKDDQAYFLELLKNKNLDIRHSAWDNEYWLIYKGVVTAEEVNKRYEYNTTRIGMSESP